MPHAMTSPSRKARLERTIHSPSRARQRAMREGEVRGKAPASSPTRAAMGAPFVGKNRPLVAFSPSNPVFQLLTDASARSSMTMTWRSG
jgi:hypothetical protein